MTSKFYGPAKKADITEKKTKKRTTRPTTEKYERELLKLQKPEYRGR
jgi:hypothetical protein